MQQKNKECETIEAINHVRMRKKIMLLCKLAGFYGDKVIKEAREVNEQSTMLWEIMFNNAPKLCTRLIEE